MVLIYPNARIAVALLLHSQRSKDMTRTPSELVSEFHEAIGLPRPNEPSIDVSDELHHLRQRLLDEEVREVAQAVRERDLTQIAKELADVVYIACGTALTYGIPFDDVFAEVHRSNMSKIGPEGPVRRADGKIMKGPYYSPANVAACLKRESCDADLVT